MTEHDLQLVDRMVAEQGRGAEDVIPILQRIQDHYHYLPVEVLRHVCDITDITPSAMIGVASFYDHFRHRPAGAHRVRVCHGTACHVRGAALVQQAIETHLDIPPGADTDAQQQYTVEKVACLGSCTLAPVVQFGKETYGHVAPQQVAQLTADYHARLARNVTGGRRRAAPTNGNGAGEIRIGLGSCCAAKGSGELLDAFSAIAADYGVAVGVQRVGCVGMCHRTPIVEVRLPDAEPMIYSQVAANDAPRIMSRSFTPRNPLRRLTRTVSQWLDRAAGEDAVEHHPLNERDPQLTAFLGPQRHVATEHFGAIDPLDLDQYLAVGGFAAPADNDPQQTIDTIKQSGLRGRGGAGFPTGAKWQAVRDTPGDVKYIICNGDEGDPGAFMDRMLLESFPYRIIEGMLIAARTVGAREGLFYIRAEYPLAVQRVAHAIEQCQQRNLLDGCTLSIRQGAGAFICGEETALIESIEGNRGSPRQRPPYPAESGYRGKPTLISNVETFACVPWIMRHGAGAFAAMGTEGSKGTKVFALAGKVKRGGLIEVPMGMTVRRIVEEIGGGVVDGRRFKAVQIGGPSGGCLPAHLADIPIDYEALKDAGAIMGSGGLVVLDDHDCMVDLARYFIQFTQDQSCGKCTFCRIGTRRLLDILERICEGKGKRSDLDELESLSRVVQRGSLCGLGATAPNPVLTTLRYFRDEYEAHLDGRCPAGRCKGLIHYTVNDRCVGCTICAQNCPADAIAMTPYQRHTIDDDACTRCDSCRALCPHDAIEVN